MNGYKKRGRHNASVVFPMLTTVLLRGGVFLSVWWILTGGEGASLWVGIPAIVITLWASMVLMPPAFPVWRSWVMFIPFFLLRSVKGGIDVGWRVFHPHLPIAPDLVEYRLTLPPGMGRIFMIMLVNLVPGTLSAELHRDVLKVHVLDVRTDFSAELEAIEKHVARMFNPSQKSIDSGVKENETV